MIPEAREKVIPIDEVDSLCYQHVIAGSLMGDEFVPLKTDKDGNVFLTTDAIEAIASAVVQKLRETTPP